MESNNPKIEVEIKKQELKFEHIYKEEEIGNNFTYNKDVLKENKKKIAKYANAVLSKKHSTKNGKN